MLVSVMWVIWSSRNKYTHEEIIYQPVKSMKIVEELIRALDVPSIERVIQKEETKWCPPGPGVLKINTDGAVDLAHGVAGAGIVVRNHDREFVSAACRRTMKARLSSPTLKLKLLFAGQEGVRFIEVKKIRASSNLCMPWR